MSLLKAFVAVVLALMTARSESFMTPWRGIPRSCSNRSSRTNLQVKSSLTLPPKVLVVGGSSGIGQLVTEKLVSGGTTVRVATRSIERSRELFSSSANLQFHELDLLSMDDGSLQSALDGMSAVVISVGTTAFPTIKWKGGNTPKAIDDEAVSKIAEALSKQDSVEKVVIVTSVGVERTGEMPFLILNLFGVLDAKRAGEDAIKACGKRYCIVRPGRLVGGPFTNLDVAKLLQVQGGAENGVEVEPGDSLLGDCKRDACAECIIQCLKNPDARNIEFSIASNDKAALLDDQWELIFQNMAK